MSKQTINIGASPNDGTGTPLRTSFDYTNQNFTEIYTALGGGVALPGATTQVIFNDGGTNLAGDAGLVYNKTTDALTIAGPVNAASASITGAATVGTTLGVTGSVSAGNLNVTNSPIPANGVYLSATNTLCLATASTLRATLTATGLGLATAPASALSFPIGTVTAVGMTAATAHLAGNVSTLKYGISDGGGDFGGVHVFNIHDGTYSSSEVGFFTGKGGVSVPTQRMRIDNLGNVLFSTPSTPPTLATNGQLSINATSNTNLRFSYRGSDGTTRVANLTLA